MIQGDAPVDPDIHLEIENCSLTSSSDLADPNLQTQVLVEDGCPTSYLFASVNSDEDVVSLFIVSDVDWCSKFIFLVF